MLLSSACTKDEFTTTGTLLVTTFGVSSISGSPVNETEIGLFDMNVLFENRFSASQAIEVQKFTEREAFFENINYGNYILAPIISGGDPNVFRKTVQIRAGQRTIVNFSD